MKAPVDKAHRYEVIFEFLLFGIVIGVIEDMLAVMLTTGESITYQTFLIIVAIAIPFAILGEIFADNVDFTPLFRRFIRNTKSHK